MKILAIGDFHGKFPAKLKKIARGNDINLIVSVGDYAGIDRWKPYIIKRFKLFKQGKPLPTLEEFFGKKGVRDLWRDDFLAGQKMLIELDKIGKPVIAIFGNGDDEWYKYPFDKDVDLVKEKTVKVLKKLQNFKIITYGTMVFQNIGFLGFGGYMDIDAHFEEDQIHLNEGAFIARKTRREKSRKKLYTNLKKISSMANKIFVFHYPPLGFFDIIHDVKDNVMNGKSAGINFFREAISEQKPSLALCGHMHEYQGMKKLGKTTIVNPGAAHDGKCAIIDFDEKKGKVKKVEFIK